VFQQTERKVIRVAERGEDEEEFNAERSSVYGHDKHLKVNFSEAAEQQFTLG